MLAIGCPVKIGVGSKNSPRLLLIHAQAVKNRLFNSGFKIANEHHRFCANTLEERHFGSIRRDRWGDRTAGSARDAFNITLFTVIPVDRINLTVRIFFVLKKSAGIYILAVVDVAAIRRDKRLTRILLIVRTLGELNT